MEATIPGARAGTVDERHWPSRRVRLGLIVFATALRLATLPLRRLVEGDGVHYAQLARQILAGDFSGLANPYWSNLWPAVIAATSAATGLDVVAAGRLAALVSGVLLTVVTAELAARVFDPTIGLVAGLLCAGHPWLVHFSTLVFTESFFAFLLVLLLLSAPRAAASAGAAARAGVVGGMAVVTRPEAYAALAVVLVWLAARAVPRRDRARIGRGIAVFALVVGAFILGRAVVVHRYFEIWDLGVGTKGTANLLVGLAENDREMERVTTQAADDGTNTLSVRAQETSVAAFARAHPARFARHVARNLVRLAGCASRVLPPVPLGDGRPGLGPGPWTVLLLGFVLATVALAAAGALPAFRDRERRRHPALLAGVGALYVLGLAPLYVHDRLVVPLAPLFLVFLAAGVVGAARRLGASEPRVRWALATGLALGGVLSLAGLWRASTLDYAGDPVVQRETGEWLAARYPQDTRLMTAAPLVGFYFYDAGHAQQEETLPWGDCDRVLAIARARGVTVLAVPEWHLLAVQHPAAPVLLHPEAPIPELHHVVTLGEEATGRMFVYETQPSAGRRERPE